MKKLFKLILCLFLFFISINFADAANITNNDVILQNGVCVYKFNSQPVTDTVVILKTGQNGNKYAYASVPFVNGSKQGMAHIYNENGDVIWDVKFANGELNGQTRSYIGNFGIAYYNFENGQIYGYVSEGGSAGSGIQLNDYKKVGMSFDRKGNKLSRSTEQIMLNQALNAESYLKNEALNFSEGL